MKVWVGLLVLTGVIASAGIACSSGTSSKNKTATSVAAAATVAAGPKTVQVQVDGDGDGFDAYMIHYFPEKITLHAGDSVKFKLKDSGEPHTVSSGAPVKDLIDFVEGYCGPERFAAPKCGQDVQPPPDVEAKFNELQGKLPQLLPDGPGDANQTSANPCFIAAGGTVPENAACTKVAQPDFKGNEALYSSGWLSEANDFTVKFAAEIKPGTYTFLCLLHGPGMTETITVVDKAADSDTADEVKARLDTELATFRGKLTKPAADLKISKGGTEGAIKWDVQGGANVDGVDGGVAEFGPAEISIAAGGSVTWNAQGPHTISFNAPEDTKGLRKVAADGTVHVNEKGASPAGVPEPPAPSDDPKAPPTLFDGGTWDGASFLSTGILGNGNGGFFKLTFAKAGTYTYKCLVHDGMEGTVKVGS